MSLETGDGTGAVGFFGKLSGAGDFVQRRLPSTFVAHWDRHFEQAVASSREQLGERWQAVWHASPVWRFVLAPGVCTESAWAGVMAPACDRVGRCFPMVMAAPLDSSRRESDPFAHVLLHGGHWFDALEHLFVQAQLHAVSADAFDAQVIALPSPLLVGHDDTLNHLRGTDWRSAPQWRLPLPVLHQPGAFLHTLWTQANAHTTAATWCLWWTHGADHVPASALLTRGLPQPASYASFVATTGQASARWATPAGLQALMQAPAKSLSPVPAPPRQETAITTTVAAVVVEPPPRLPDDLADLLDGIGALAYPGSAASHGSDVTVPGYDRHSPASVAPMAAVAVVTVVPRRAPMAGETASPPHQGGAVYRSADGALAVLAADDGAHDARCCGAITAHAVASAMLPGDFFGGMQTLRDRLLARHPLLQLSGEDLIDPVMEDTAVLALHTTGRWAALLRIGSGEVWQWRHGEMRQVFDVEPEQSDGVDDLLRNPTSPIAAGLGAAGTPHADEIVCAVERGDRFLLLATRRLVGLDPTLLARALGLPTSDDARAFIARAAALGADPEPWPLAVIEILP